MFTGLVVCMYQLYNLVRKEVECKNKWFWFLFLFYVVNIVWLNKEDSVDGGVSFLELRLAVSTCNMYTCLH